MSNDTSNSSPLKQWAMSYLQQQQQQQGENHGQPKERQRKSKLVLPRILLLDGGVSTHLECTLTHERLLQRRQEQDEKEMIRLQYDRERQVEEGPVFSNRLLWSSSLLLSAFGKEAIRNCHEEFYDAGADVASTVTYQCHYRCGDDDFPDQDSMDQMLREAVRLAKRTATGSTTQRRRHHHQQKQQNDTTTPLFVAASIGCYGASLADGSEYRGKYDVTKLIPIHAGDERHQNEKLEDYLIRFHQRKSEILLREKPDAIAYETIPCWIECASILNLWKRRLLGSSSSPYYRDHLYPLVWLSLACRDERHLNDGTLLEDTLKKIDEMDPTADVLHGVGINCCSFAYVVPLVTIIAKQMVSSGVKRAIVLYPNSGESWDAIHGQWVEGSGADETAFGKIILDAVVAIDSVCSNGLIRGGSDSKMRGGVGWKLPIIVGGCCRTSPGTISAVRALIDSYQ